MSKLRSLIIRLILFAFLFAIPVQSSAVDIPLIMISDGTVGGTLIYYADLTGIAGLTQIGSITVTDDGTPVGGSPGIFSGFDIDAAFLDVDGSLATSADRYFASSYLFTAGTTRPTADPTMLPNVSHPGPTFGSLDANNIDLTTATLDVFDAISVADVNSADGFLTLGDGGILQLLFNPATPIGSTLYLLAGEVGGQAGEGLGATVTVSSIPEPSSLYLLGVGLAGVGFLRRRFKK